MLSRIAESLYWIGRYVERADDTARILDVHAHDFVQSAEDEDRACRVLLEVMGLTEVVGEVDVARLNYLLALDPDNAGSIARSIAAARECARGARESISAEMWESLNATWHMLQLDDWVASSAAHSMLRLVRERAALFVGLTDTTMSRDSAWRFIVLGQSLERVDMTARLLCSRVGQSTVPHDWVTLLSSCSAYEAFLRSRRSRVTPESVVHFLLLDRLFPRSIFHALITAETCIAALGPGVSAGARFDEARRVLGQARARLEYEPFDRLAANLAQELALLQDACSAAAHALGRAQFRHVDVFEWTAEEVTV